MNDIKLNTVSRHISKPLLNNSCENASVKNKEQTEKGNLKDTTDISKEAELEYNFLKRIEYAAGADKKNFCLKYLSEYEKIKKEIKVNKYGSNVEEITKLLDKAYKDSFDNAAKEINNEMEQEVKKPFKINYSGKTLIKYHKQYESATQIVWVLQAENKRIAQEIEEYRRKKNHRKVAELTQLKNENSVVINNTSQIAEKINSDINENFSDKDSEKKDS